MAIASWFIHKLRIVNAQLQISKLTEQVCGGGGRLCGFATNTGTSLKLEHQC